VASAAERLLFVDSDAFVLLAGAGMLEKCAGLLGFPLSNTRRLDALPYMLKKGRLPKSYPADAIAAAMSTCTAIAALTAAPSEQSSAWVTDAPGIDPGEAFLFAHMLDDPRTLLLTGDKRALVALAGTPSLAAVATSVAGRVVCVEAALSLLVRNLGISQVAPAFQPLRTASATLRVVFSEVLCADQNQCLDALEGYFSALNAETGGTLLWRPSVPE
jgi:hypothetical protein